MQHEGKLMVALQDLTLPFQRQKPNSWRHSQQKGLGEVWQNLIQNKKKKTHHAWESLKLPANIKHQGEQGDS